MTWKDVGHYLEEGGELAAPRLATLLVAGIPGILIASGISVLISVYGDRAKTPEGAIDVIKEAPSLLPIAENKINQLLEDQKRKDGILLL